MSVLYRIEKTAQQVVPAEKRLERIDPLHAEHLAEIGLQPLLPAEVILPVVGIKVADDVPAHRHIGHPHSPVREQPEDEAAPRGEAGLCAPVSVPAAPGIGEQAACRRRVESLAGQCMLDVEDSLAGDPIGIVLPGGRRRNGVPVFANERFIIRYVVGKSRDEEPREERNLQLPGAAVGIIPGRSIRYRRFRLNGGLQPFPLHTNQRNGSRSCRLRRRSGRIRKEEGRGKRPEYLLQRLRFGP